MRVSALAPLKGSIAVPGDKSVSHRAAIFGALASGQINIFNFAPGADCESTLGALEALGIALKRSGSAVWMDGGGGILREPDRVIDCGNAGTSMRLLLGVLAGQPFHAVLAGDPSLSGRPMGRVTGPLGRMGARVRGRDGGAYPPLSILGGSLRAISHRSAVASAQVKSAVLLAGLYCEGQTSVWEPQPSRDHTERMLEHFGATVSRSGTEVFLDGGGIGALEAPRELRVPGDFSSAAFMIAAALLVPDSEVEIRDVGLNPGRAGMLEVLRQMGARVTVRNQRLWGLEPVGDVVAAHGELTAFDVPDSAVPSLIDEIPILSLLAARARGRSVFHGVGELRVKETDRLAAIAEELNGLGGRVEIHGDDLLVEGPSAPECGIGDSRGDHRMAMTLMLSGLPHRRVEVRDARAVSISYPGFVDDVEALGATVHRGPARQMLGLIGDPVSHSLSPGMFRAAFEELGLEGSYQRFRVPDEDLREGVAALKTLGFGGFNVTVPHKVRIRSHLDALDESARAVGAVNTVVVEEGRLIGHNTDVHGVLGALEEGGFDPRRRSALILGAGGAARAALGALGRAGVREVHIGNRTREAAESLADQGNRDYPGVRITASSLGDIPAGFDLIVQCTPLGMAPLEDRCPLAENYPLDESVTLLEMVYNPAVTPLVRRAERAGSPVIRGLEMLVHQGAKALELWTGLKAPVPVMRDALRRELEC